MESGTPYQPVEATGWRLGLANLFSKEIGEWLETRRWLIQLILWIVVLNGFLAAVLFILPNIVTPEGGVPIENPAVEGMIGFFGLGGIALSIGMIILTQNEIIGEKQSGTAEWVLSKPVSRSAFYLSKLGANLLGMLVVMILVPSAIGYALVSIANPGAIQLSAFLAGVGMMTLHVFFYLSLTLLMGVVGDSREMVLGVAMGVLFVGMIARDFIGQVALLTPWLLSDFAGVTAIGEPLGMEMWLSIAATAVWSIGFIGLALWRFERLEF